MKRRHVLPAAVAQQALELCGRVTVGLRHNNYHQEPRLTRGFSCLGFDAQMV